MTASLSGIGVSELLTPVGRMRSASATDLISRESLLDGRIRKYPFGFSCGTWYRKRLPGGGVFCGVSSCSWQRSVSPWNRRHCVFTLYETATRGGTTKGIGTIGNNGSWSLFLSRTSVNISASCIRTYWSQSHSLSCSQSRSRAVSWFPLFRTDKIPWLFQYFFHFPVFF